VDGSTKGIAFFICEPCGIIGSKFFIGLLQVVLGKPSFFEVCPEKLEILSPRLLGWK
jgi:hypothetical protein